MIAKKITLVLVPEGTTRVKQISLPTFLLLFFFLAFVFCATSLCWIIRDYQSMTSQMPRLALLQKENAQHKRQCIHLVKRIDRITQKMGELAQLDLQLRAMVNMETSEENPELKGVGDPGPTQPNDSVAKPQEDSGRLLHRSLVNLESKMAFGSQDMSGLFKFLENQKMRNVSIPSIWPTRGWLSCGFGDRPSPFIGEREFHEGINISTRMNAPIVAPADGVVSSLHWDQTSGQVININHDHGLTTRYAYCQEALVKKGQYVRQGETIALVGSTGRSRGPHLHYEVHLNGLPVNPLRYMVH